MRLRTAHVGVVSQRSGLDLIDDLDCLDNVALQSRLGRPAVATRAGGRQPRRWIVSGLGHLPTAARRRSLAENVSESRSPRRSLTVPGLVIADEPTGELDAISADQVYDFLREHAERTGAALLVVTHDDRAERIATRVLTIHDGRLSEETLDGRHHVGGRRSRMGAAARFPARRCADRRPRGCVGDDGHISLVGSGPVASAASGVTFAFGIGGKQIGTTLRSASARRRSTSTTTTIGPVSMELRRGQITVITGRSGSGKTSVLSIVLGVSQPTRGVVERPSPSFGGCAPQTRCVRRPAERHRQRRPRPRNSVEPSDR